MPRVSMTDHCWSAHTQNTGSVRRNTICELARQEPRNDQGRVKQKHAPFSMNQRKCRGTSDQVVFDSVGVRCAQGGLELEGDVLVRVGERLDPGGQAAPLSWGTDDQTRSGNHQHTAYPHSHQAGAQSTQVEADDQQVQDRGESPSTQPDHRDR